MKTSKNIKKFIDNSHKNNLKSYDPFQSLVSQKQKRIAEAVKAGRVTFEVWAMDSETKQTERFVLETNTSANYFQQLLTAK